MSKKEKDFTPNPAVTAGLLSGASLEQVQNMPHAIQKIGGLSQDMMNVIDGDLPKDFDGTCAVIKRLIVATTKHMLLHAWGIGRLVENIQTLEGGRYGAKAVERIAAATHQSPRNVSDMLKLYNAIPNEGGVSKLNVEWSTARETLRLPDPAVREAVLTKAAKDHLSVREVREVVNTELKKNKPKAAKQERQVQALPFFKKMQAELERCRDELDRMKLQLPDFVRIVSDEKRTSDEDYNLIVEGDPKTKTRSILGQITVLAQNLSGVLNRDIITIEGQFSK